MISLIYNILCIFIVLVDSVSINKTLSPSSSKSKMQTQKKIWTDDPEPVIINWSYGNVGIYIYKFKL